MNNCPIHGNQGNPDSREELETVMKKLPESQAGVGRHKCSYCAYEEGYKVGYKKAKQDLG